MGADPSAIVVRPHVIALSALGVVLFIPTAAGIPSRRAASVNPATVRGE
jgi:ABC-type lipoprotein release transport system permease subunit